MKKAKASPLEAVKISYPQLADESRQLNQEIGNLATSVSGIESSLRRIGLSVSAWHEIAAGENDTNGYSWSRDIGYTRIGEYWHIAVREWSQEQGLEPEESVYKFADAPPWMCLEAAGKIPELLETLIERTRDMRTKINRKKNEVDELAAVLADLAQQAMDANR